MFEDVTRFSCPVIFFSGGLDSTLLVALAKEAGLQVDVVAVGKETWTKKQRQRVEEVMKYLDITVFSYPPANIGFLGDGTQNSAVFEYAIGGDYVPMIRDVIPGDKCIADLDGMKAFTSPILWDCVLVGSRKADRHYTLEYGVAPNREWKVGQATFLAPLYDMTREEVREALKLRGLPCEEVEDDEDTGNLSICVVCMNAIEGEVFCPEEQAYIPAMGGNLLLNLERFRKRFEVTH